LSQNINVLSQNINVLSQNINVLPQNINVLSQNINVLPQNINVLSQNINVLSQNINVLSQNINVLSQNINVLSQNINVLPPPPAVSDCFISFLPCGSKRAKSAYRARCGKPLEPSETARLNCASPLTGQGVAPLRNNSAEAIGDGLRRQSPTVS
jgi:cell division protein FtsB